MDGQLGLLTDRRGSRRASLAETMLNDVSVDQEKLAAVRHWLKGKFAGSQVYEEPTFLRTSKFYRIEEGSDSHRISVSREFFDDYSAEEIGLVLEGWNTAGLIRSARGQLRPASPTSWAPGCRPNGNPPSSGVASSRGASAPPCRWSRSNWRAEDPSASAGTLTEACLFDRHHVPRCSAGPGLLLVPHRLAAGAHRAKALTGRPLA